MRDSFEPRLYQERIFAKAADKNSLIVLPTGLGKTAIGIMLAEHRLDKYPDSKVIMLAPTKPLVNQHLESFQDLLPEYEDDAVVFTGDVRPARRAELWDEKQIILSTPQGMENDLISDRVDIGEASLVLFDEAHRATGDYAYNYIAEQYIRKSNHSRIAALTASPGSDEDKILEVCDNLYINHIEYRSEESEDVKQYVQETKVDYIEVDFPKGLKEVQSLIKKSYNAKLEDAAEMGAVSKKVKDMNKTSLLKLMNKLHAKAQKEENYKIFKTISLIAESLKVHHALELLETQGVQPLLEYYDELKEKSKKTKVKAVKNLMKDHTFKSAMIKAESLEDEIKHPKLEKALSLIADELEQGSSKIILFTQYRDTAKVLKDELAQHGISGELFVGQSKKKGTGLTQKQQKEMIRKFKDEAFEVLIATSVGEEGLDIPEVDYVLFYEPVPSAIRTVQRRGRTGRQKEGKVSVLITKDTRDEGYRWSSYHKEKKMYRNLKRAKKNLSPKKTTLEDFTKTEYTVKADHREKGSQVLKKLIEKNVDVELEQLEVGDYLIGEETVVEFKNTDDFVESIVDNRMIQQLKDLQQYQQPMLILQGSENLYTRRRVHPNAIRGMIYTITKKFGIPLIRTNDPLDTAGYLKYIAEKEQEDEELEFQLHSSKPLQDEELQEYIVSSFPGIGKKIAKNLLEEFGTVQDIVTASKEELKETALVGDKTADRLVEIFQKSYS